MASGSERRWSLGVEHVDHDGEDRPNILFVPACSCPRCTAEIVTDTGPQSQWLRVHGQAQRLRVEVLALGEQGAAMLG